MGCTGWVVGTNLGVFVSPQGQEPWARVDPGLGPLDWTAFATQGPGQLFAAFDIAPGAVIEESADDGASWQIDEGLPNVFVQELAISKENLYAARGDGLWRRPIGGVAAAGAARSSLRFALAGPQPFRESARLIFDLPEPGPASIDFFDLQGRAAASRMAGAWSAGRHEVTLDAGHLAAGIYLARLTAGGTQRIVRLVHIR